MNIDKELLQVLMEIAFMAQSQGRLKEAEVIFDGIAHFRPGSAYPLIGLADVAMYRGELDRSIEILTNAPHRNAQEKELSTAFLGKALKLAGYNEKAQRVLSGLKENGTYDVARNMAGALLETDFSALNR